MSSMDERIQFFTDTATLAIFDNEMLASRLSDDGDWWCFDFASIDEVKEGKISLISLGGDGTFVVRITDGELLPVEQDYAIMRFQDLGVEIVSGSMFVGNGECIPGEDFSTSPENIENGEGRFISLSPGKYSLEVYLIDWFDSPNYWNSEYKTPDNAPADIVILVRSRDKSFKAYQHEPHLVPDSSEFLFESVNRVVGPIPGMLLETKVWKNSKGLTLKDCGPLNYKPIAEDYSKMQWKDKVRIKVVSVDHEKKTMDVEYLETVNS